MQIKNYHIYAAGKFITTNYSLEIKNPFKNSVVATTYLADKSILEDSITQALSVKEELKSLSPQKSTTFLNKFLKNYIITEFSYQNY
jgi:hypothetical protein